MKKSLIYIGIFAALCARVSCVIAMEKEPAEITYGRNGLERLWLSENQRVSHSKKSGVLVARAACRALAKSLTVEYFDEDNGDAPTALQLSGRFCNQKKVRDAFLKVIAKDVKGTSWTDEDGTRHYSPHRIEIDLLDYNDAIIEAYIAQRAEQENPQDFNKLAIQNYKDEGVAEYLLVDDVRKPNKKSFLYGMGTGALMTTGAGVAGWWLWKTFSRKIIEAPFDLNKII